MLDQPIARIDRLRVTFQTRDGPVAGVADLSFDINPGETVCVVGESGSGKSVSSLSLMRLVEFGGGEIAGGRLLFDRREGGETDLTQSTQEAMRGIRGNEIGMIFQEPMTALNPQKTVGGQIDEVLRLHTSMSKAERKARAIEMLGRVHIPDPESAFNAHPHQISGGQRQRVMIAMSLVLSPKLIIADEPTTALDVTIQAQILELMKELTKNLGVSMIIITHNLGVVARYADRVNVMYAGKIIETGTAQDIYHNPQHPYTLALLNSIPRMDQPRKAKLDPVEGQPPDLTQLDDGCSFRFRCRFAGWRGTRCYTAVTGRICRSHFE